jgi:membrane-associated protein
VNLEQIIIAIGYFGLLAVIFAESGLLIGVFFPGDSLLFTAGFLASQGVFDITALIVGCFLAAVLGDNVGYTFGKRVGKKFFTSPNSLFFNQGNLEKASAFYAKHGGKTIILARFVPGVRTLAPILAGVGDMHYPTFLIYNLMGGFLWAIGLTGLGYSLGSVIPGVDRYILPIIIFIIIISFLPPFIQTWRDVEQRRQLFNALAQLWRKLWRK